MLTELTTLTKVLEEKVFESGHAPGKDPRFTCWKVGFDSKEGKCEIIHTIIKSKPSVASIIRDAEGNLAFIQQFRSTTGKWHFEIPAGLIEVFKGESILEATVREPREEAGLLVKDPSVLVKGPSVLDPSKSDEDYGVATATCYEQKSQCLDEMEVIYKKVTWLSEGEAFYRLLMQQFAGVPFKDDLSMTGHSTYALLNFFLLKLIKRYCALLKEPIDEFDKAIIKFVEK